MNRQIGWRAGVRGMSATVLAAVLCSCAEAKFEVVPAPDAPSPSDATNDAAPGDAPVVPDAPWLDATGDSSEDAGADAVVDAPTDGGSDGAVDAAPDAPPPPPPPPADVCTTAIDVTTQAKAAGGYVTQDTTVGFYNDAYDSCGFSNYAGLDRVYRFDLTAGDILTVLAQPTQGSTIDMALSLLNGCGAAEACVSSADSGYTGDPESIVLIATATSSYYLYVDAYSSNMGGPFALNVIITTPLAP